MESIKPYEDGMKTAKQPLNIELLKILSAKGIQIQPSLLKHCKRLCFFLLLMLVGISIQAQSELKIFTANFSGSKIELFWQISDENNTNYYAVEKSLNGKEFETIGLVKAKGNANSLTIYSFFDKDYFENVIYYRLKSMSNGVTEKSLAGIVAVQINEEIKETAIYPLSYIPNMIYVDVSRINKDKLIVDVTDADGQKLANAELDKSRNEYAIALKANYFIQKGEYTLTAFYDNHIIKSRLSIRDSAVNFSEKIPLSKIKTFTLK